MQRSNDANRYNRSKKVFLVRNGREYGFGPHEGAFKSTVKGKCDKETELKCIICYDAVRRVELVVPRYDACNLDVDCDDDVGGVYCLCEAYHTKCLLQQLKYNPNARCTVCKNDFSIVYKHDWGAGAHGKNTKRRIVVTNAFQYALAIYELISVYVNAKYGIFCNMDMFYEGNIHYLRVIHLLVTVLGACIGQDLTVTLYSVLCHFRSQRTHSSSVESHTLKTICRTISFALRAISYVFILKTISSSVYFVCHRNLSNWLLPFPTCLDTDEGNCSNVLGDWRHFDGDTGLHSFSNSDMVFIDTVSFVSALIVAPLALFACLYSLRRLAYAYVGLPFIPALHLDTWRQWDDGLLRFNRDNTMGHRVNLYTMAFLDRQ